jgi:PBSX family phage terminase large subunit
MKLTQKQAEIAKDTTRFRVINAGRRFGKTVLAVEEMIGAAIAKKDRRIAYIAPTYQQARDIAWENLKKRCVPIAANVNESRLEIELRTQDEGTSKIVLRGWESVETLRGQRFDFLVIDEVAMMRNFWIGWQEVLRPTLTDTQGGALFISTPKGFNHFYDLYTNPDYKAFHATTYDNPHIPLEEVDEAKSQMSEDRFYQEYMADFRKMEGLVFKEFDRDIHIYDDKTERPEIAEVICGIDFGYTNPTAILKIEKDKDLGYWVSWEWYRSERPMTEIVEMATSVKATTYYPDPAEPDRIAELERAGLNIHDVSKDVEAGIETVRSLLKQKRLHVHESCVNLVNEFETYRYQEAKPDKNLPEQPVKEHDHSLDAMRYALHMNAPQSAFINSDELRIYG